jgi:MFS family permease
MLSQEESSLSSAPAKEAPHTPLSKRYLAGVFLGCWLGGVFDGLDSTLFHMVQPVAIGEFLNTQNLERISPVAGQVNFWFLIGWMLGGVAFGWVGDRFGRVKAMLGSILLYSFCTGLCGFAQSWEQLALFRFLTGLGIGGELVSIATFISEVWPARTKAIAMGFLLTSYQAGVFLAGGLHFWIHDWRQLFWIGTIPALLVVGLRFFMKESDQWAEAQESQNPDDPRHWLDLLKDPQNRWNLILGALAFTGLLVGYWASLAWIPTFLKGLAGLPESATSQSIMVQGGFAILGCSLSGILSKGVGIERVILLGAFLSFAGATWLFGWPPFFTVSIFQAIALYSFGIGLLQASLYIFIPQLFPVLVRASSTGLCLNAGRLITALSVLMVGPLVQWFGGVGKAAWIFSWGYLLPAMAMLLFLARRRNPKVVVQTASSQPSLG